MPAEFNLQDYIQKSQTGPCFICEMVKGNPDYRHHIIYEDEDTIVFLNKYPTLYGYTLVCPKEHIEQVVGGFSQEAYLRLQSVIYHTAQALQAELNPERVYILSLGSQQGNSHVHWHLAPLPPGVPYENQQCEAISLAENPVLTLTESEKHDLAARIADRMKNGGIGSIS